MIEMKYMYVLLSFFNFYFILWKNEKKMDIFLKKFLNTVLEMKENLIDITSCRI